MSYLSQPQRARLRPRHIEDHESQRPAPDSDSNYTEQEQHTPFESLRLTRLLSFLILEYPKLAFNYAQFGSPPSTETIPPRRMIASSPGSRFGRPQLSNNNAHELNTASETKAKDMKSTFASESEFAFSDAREVAHKNRKKILTERLGPLLEDGTNASVLLCWGERYSCSILPVVVSDPVDEVTTWREIHQAWYTHRGQWRKHLPFYGITQVSIVELSIVGENPKSSRSKAEYIGMYTIIDTHAERKRLEHIIDDYEPREFQCSYNLYTGTVDCLEGCVSTELDHVQCPDERFFNADRGLSLLNTHPLMKLIFSNPKLAALNDFLKGEGIVHSHADVLGKLNEWHCSELRELRFRGIIISEGWRISTQPMILSLTVTILLIIVVAAKFTFYDWGTAWNVGCFFATLTTIPWIWAHMAT